MSEQKKPCPDCGHVHEAETEEEQKKRKEEEEARNKEMYDNYISPSGRDSREPVRIIFVMQHGGYVTGGCTRMCAELAVKEWFMMREAGLKNLVRKGDPQRICSKAWIDQWAVALEWVVGIYLAPAEDSTEALAKVQKKFIDDAHKKMNEGDEWKGEGDNNDQ